MQLISTSKKAEIREILKDSYGLDIDGTFLVTGENKIRFFSGNIDAKSISKIIENLHVESFGIYLGKLFPEGFRLSFDAANLFSDKINKNIIEVSSQDITQWFKGANLQAKRELNGFYIIKHKSDVIGCAKVSQGSVYNYVPREKRVLKGIY